MISNQIFFFAIVLLSCVFSASAFWWGSSQVEMKPDQPAPWPVIAYYQRRTSQGRYGVENEPIPVQIPSIPIQSPLKAQMSPASNVHNVQLVPCLCPVAQDYEYEKVDGNVVISEGKPIKMN